MLSVDTFQRVVTNNEGTVSRELTPRELQILNCLQAKSKSGKWLSRKELEREVWVIPSSHTKALDVHVMFLRRKLEPLGFSIRCVRGRGFGLVQLEDIFA